MTTRLRFWEIDDPLKYIVIGALRPASCCHIWGTLPSSWSHSHFWLDKSDPIPQEATCHCASSYTVKCLVTPIKHDARFATTYALVTAAPGHLASNAGMGHSGDGWPAACGSLPARRFSRHVFGVTWLDISTSTANDIPHRSSPDRSDM